MFTISSSVFLVISALYFTFPTGNGHNFDHEFEQIGPNELTEFLVERLGGYTGRDFKNWNKRSNDEVKAIFSKHSLKYLNPVPCRGVNCIKNYTDDAFGTAQIDSHLTEGNLTIDAKSQIGVASSIKYSMMKGHKEEAHSLFASINSTFQNQGKGFDYTVDKNFTYDGGVKIRWLGWNPDGLMDLEPEFASDYEKDSLNRFRLDLFRVKSQSELEEIIVYRNHFERIRQVTEISATVVTFDNEACDNTVEGFDCSTMARAYHHIKSSSERRTTFEGITNSLKIDSSGVTITVVKAQI